MAAQPTYFDEVLPQLVRSHAYGCYCEDVYGKNLAQFNRADMKQLEELLAALALSPGARVLDVGCGNGCVTEYLAEQSGATFVGFDSSAAAIQCARERNSAVTFFSADMRDLPNAPAVLEHPELIAPFDAIVSIDTLGNQPDLVPIIASFTDLLAPNGQMAFLHGEHLKLCIEDELEAAEQSTEHAVLQPREAHDGQQPNAHRPREAHHDLQPRKAHETYDGRDTRMCKALVDLGFEVELHDHTASERQLWQRSLRAERAFQPLFEQEGACDLYLDITADGDDFREMVAHPSYRRYLYHGRRTSS